MDPDRYDHPFEAELLKAIVPMIADKFSDAHLKGMEHKKEIAEIQLKDNREHRKQFKELEEKRIEADKDLRLDAHKHVFRVAVAAMTCLLLVIITGAFVGDIRESAGVAIVIGSMAAGGFGVFQWGRNSPKDKQSQYQ